MNILIADDDSVLRNLLEIILSRFDIKPDSANDGEEALAIATTNHYDIIFMDYNMPYLNGFEVAKKLRTQEEKEALKPAYIAIMSGYYKMFSEKYDQYKSKNNKIINTIIEKPFNYKDIEKIITVVKKGAP